MKTTKYLGIWMDSSTAHIIEYGQETPEIQVINSKSDSSTKGEHQMHNKEQHLQSDYYKELGDVIRNYDEVILFGPTNAKVELLNILQENQQFANIKIETQTADKMTDSQQQAFVKDYFAKH